MIGGARERTRRIPGRGDATQENMHLTLRTLMQAGPAKANELFARLAETSDGALKTRERLFAELKAELETHADLEEHRPDTGRPSKWARVRSVLEECRG
jgi:hypothetical protein